MNATVLEFMRKHKAFKLEEKSCKVPHLIVRQNIPRQPKNWACIMFRVFSADEGADVAKLILERYLHFSMLQNRGSPRNKARAPELDTV